MIRHYTYQLAVLMVLGPVMAVVGLFSGDLRVAVAGLGLTILGVLGYLHGRKNE